MFLLLYEQDMAEVVEATSTQHDDLSKSQIIGKINIVGEDIKATIDNMLEEMSNRPIFGRRNSKDKLSEVLYDMNLLFSKLSEIDFGLVCERRARNENSDTGSGSDSDR